ncbi:MAG: ABC transporter permease [Candidatus Krumholzibacteria bacterium]|nr:ABC transporter permease [Candidatus Krumholzibacteria bacterium]
MIALLRNISYRAAYVWRRNLDVNLVTWQTNFLPPILEPLLYIVAFGFMLGRYVERIAWAGIELDFLTFVAPGMISVAILYHSTFECMYGSFVRMYYQKTFDAIIATPLLIEDVIAGEILWAASKSFFAASIMLVIVSFFGLVEYPSGLVIVLLAFVGGVMFGSFGMIFAAICPSIDTMNLPVFLAVTPMFLFSGTFFPVEGLPAWGRAIAAVSPLTHVVAVARAASLGVLSTAFLPSALYIVAVGAGLFLLAVHLMKRRLVK